VVQSANLWDSYDAAVFWRLDHSRLRRVLGKRQMRARGVVISQVVFQHAAEVGLIEDDYVIEAFPADGPSTRFATATEKP
jgi:hypothetical protein